MASLNHRSVFSTARFQSSASFAVKCILPFQNYPAFPFAAPQSAEFVIWDVQHGHSTYVNMPNGRHMVIDLGIGSYGENVPFSPLLHLKNRYGVHQLDCVVITHPHRDHIDDIFNFDKLSPLALYRPQHLTAAQILDGNKKNDSAEVKEYLKISARYSAPIQPGSSTDMSASDQCAGCR
jgi:beta-lactamase superfamily II metal-dependent hydrolase